MNMSQDPERHISDAVERSDNDDKGHEGEMSKVLRGLFDHLDVSR